MLCPRCSSQIDDDATFCGHCGAQVSNAQATPKPAAGKSKRTAIIVSFVCIVIVLTVGIGIFAYMQMKKSEAEHVTTEVQVTFAYASDAANAPIGVPLLVEGTDLDGAHVEQQTLAPLTGAAFELMAGNYTVSVAGQPASESGIVYATEGSSSRTLEIPVPTGSETTPQIIPALSFSFVPVSSDTLSDRQIEDVRSWMNAYGVDSSEIDRVIVATVDRRASEVARLTLERERQAALDSNPSTVYGVGPVEHTPSYQLTGTVCVDYFDSGIDAGNVCYLQLPASITLTGTPYEDMTSRKVILPESFSSYRGQVVTISSRFSGNSTATIKEAEVSPIWAYNATVVRTF